jgi:hypothetical protein
MISNTDAAMFIAQECDDLKFMLLDKNRKYGNSALCPQRIFSKADAIEQIKVRIDDKLSRLVSGQSDDTEDVERDLMGYLVLLRVARTIHRLGIIVHGEDLEAVDSEGC